MKIPAEFNPLQTLRSLIAAKAARFIAEDGADYGNAKRKAAQQLLGNRRLNSDTLPDNSQIEQEVRLYNALFLADTQPARLHHLRQLALQLMTEMVAFCPYLTGAVCNGTAGTHSDIHMELFVDSCKDVEMYLLNSKVAFSVSDRESKSNPAPEEVIHLVYKNEGVHLALYQTDALRGSIRPHRHQTAHPERLSLAAAQILFEQQNGRSDPQSTDAI